MRYRIVERKNKCNNSIVFAVEQNIALSLGDKNNWSVCKYYDELDEPKYAFFDTVTEAEIFIKSEAMPIVQKVIKEIEL